MYNVQNQGLFIVHCPLSITNCPFSIRSFAAHSGGLAQLARAPALQAGGQRFESVILHSRGRMSGVRRHPGPSLGTAVPRGSIIDMLGKNEKLDLQIK